MNDDENRKRGHQDDYEAAFSSKRAALGTSSGGTTTPSLYSSESEAHLFKLLCPQSITGLIIGRKGAIINQLNQSTGAKIRLSQNNEFFPGTTDRILLINGSKDCIANALNELVSRIADAPEKKTTPSVDAYGNPVPPVNRGPQGAYQVRVLIPKIASAAIIGRKGAVIQRMGEQSNCKFQLGEENDPYGTRERILSISSPVVENLVLGTQTLMAELLADPRIRTYPNTTTNYSGSVSGHSPGSTPVLSSVGMSNQGGFKSQPAPMPYSNMNNNMSNMNSNGPPPLLQTSYGPPPTGYGMQIPPPNQYMMQMQMPPGYNPQMPPQVMMTHHMQHPGIPQPQMYSMVPNQQFSINPNGAMMPPPTMYAPGPVGGYPPMQQQDGNHQYQVQQQYQVQANMPAMPNMPNMTNMPAMMMPAHMYASHGHMNMKK